MVGEKRVYRYIALSLILIILDFLSLLNPLKSYMDIMVIPIQKNIFQLRTDTIDLYNYIIHFRSLSKVISENSFLRQEKEESDFQLAFLKNENEKLRKQLGAPLPAPFQFVPASIISVFETMEIDVGQKDGIKTGMVVVSETKFVGKIQSVSMNRSIVQLPTDPQMEVAATTQNGTKGIVTGQRAGTVLFDKVLQKDQLLLEDQVFTSGEDGTPPRLIVGSVASITSDDTNAYKQARLNSVIDYSKESVVFVITAQ